MEAGPSLSVIIASYNARDTIRQCLQSLAVQTMQELIEVIVVDSSNDGTGDLVAGEFPWVRLVRVPHRMYCGDARNTGLANARGQIVALMDADCTARRNWAEEILQAHETISAPAIGGAIANGNPQSYVGWAAYFSEFSDWMPGKAAGFRRDIAGAGMSYKKEVFDRFGTFIRETYCSDTEFHWRLAREGIQLHFEPAIQVFHRNIPSLGRFLRHEFQHGSFFAQVRAAYFRFKRIRRLAYALLFPLIAVKLAMRVCTRGITNLRYRKFFILSLPLTLLGIFFWSAGEARGYCRRS